MITEEILSSRTIYEGRILKLRVDTVQTGDGRQTTREIIEHAACIAVIAVDADDNILLVKQYRSAPEKELLEIPAGGIDPGEDPAQAACRELQEETGYFPQKLERLGGFYSAPGFCTEYLHLFLATELIFNPLVAEDTEGIKVIRLAQADIPGLIASGEICDAKSIAGLLRCLQML